MATAPANEYAARALASRAVRLALPIGTAAVCVGSAGARILIASPSLTIADVLAAARRCVPADGSLVRIVRTDELRTGASIRTHRS